MPITWRMASKSEFYPKGADGLEETYAFSETNQNAGRDSLCHPLLRRITSLCFIAGLAGVMVSLVQLGSSPAFAQQISVQQARSAADQGPGRRASIEIANATKQLVLESSGKLPLSFEANQGQVDSQVKFLSRGSAYTLFLTPREAVLALTTGQAARSALSGKGHVVRVPKASTDTPVVRSAVLRMSLVGANPGPVISPVDRLPGRSYYFIGNDPKKWHSDIPNYAKVVYKDVYPGVSLVYYGNQGQLEHDFVVAPGADPKAITIRFQGPRRLRTDGHGDLVLDVCDAQVRLLKPRIYQEAAGVTREIAGRYVLKGVRQVSFQIAAYDEEKPLVIDPVLSYSTYLGGNGNDEGNGIAIDSSGNAYVTGLTRSTNFPTVNPLPPPNNALQGGSDAFVSKLSFSGSTLSLAYSAYLGGNGNDEGNGIAVDSSGNAYVTGVARSTNFPTVNPLPPPNNALRGEDAFVSKLSFSGSTLSLVYSTYLGGSGDDQGRAIAVDSSGNAYVTGFTTSTDFPVVHPLPPPNNARQGPENAFVSKLSFSGSTLSLVYSTYLGGSNVEQGTGIAIDSTGNAYVTGFTESTNFPTVNPLPPPNNALQGPMDAFISKLSFSGSTLSLAYSAYLGGNGFDEPVGIAVDSSGNAYVTGGTKSTNFPTVNPLPPPNNALQGGENAFVSKLSFSGSTLSLAYSTYLGGSGVDIGRAIAVDSSGNAYVTGFTGSTNFPTVNPLPPPNNALQGPVDAFVSKLSFSGSTLSLAYSIYLGGSGPAEEEGSGIAVDSSGNAYVTGTTGSPTFPTVNPLPPPNNALQGGSDAFVTKIVGVSPDFSLSPVSPMTVSVSESASTAVTVNSLNAFNSSVALSVSALPSGVSVSLSPSSVTPPGGGSASSTLTVTLGPSVTPSTSTSTVTGTSGSLTHSTPVNVTVFADTSNIANVIRDLLAAGCIDNSGIANALTSKLSAAQAAINAGRIRTAIKILTALKKQIRAQAGKHIARSCAIGGVTFDPVTVLLTDVQSLIDSLSQASRHSHGKGWE